MSDRRETLINIGNGLIQSGALYDLCKTDGMRRVLLYLVSISVNGPLKFDIYDIYEQYYKKGKIAACVHYKTIMNKCHLKDRNNFMITLRKLEEKGFIKREKAKRKDGIGWQQNVYVLGKVFRYGDDKKLWKQLFIMDAFYKLYPDREPGNE